MASTFTSCTADERETGGTSAGVEDDRLVAVEVGVTGVEVGGGRRVALGVGVFAGAGVA